MQKYQRTDEMGGITVEAVQLNKENVSAVAEWCVGKEVEEIDSQDGTTYVGLNLICWDGMRRASEGDYIVKDHLGDFHVRWPENFEDKFRKV